MVTTPIGLRYHPVIVAQAGATLAQMYPSRLWMALGSGEALNERAVGMGWPGKEERNARLGEAVDIMRALWAGETVTRHGHIPVDEAKLYSLPAVPPRLIGAALSPQTARWAGGWADGLVTVNQPRDKLRDILQAFAEGGGAGKPAYLQVHVSYAASQAEAEANAVQQWRTNALPSAVAAELRSPEMFDAATAHVAVDHLRDSVRMSSDLALHADWIGEDLEQGFEALFLHNVGRNQHEFIEVFGRSVLPQFAGS